MFKEKKYKKVVLKLDKVIKFDSNYVGAYVYRAKSNLKLKNYSLALKDFKRVIVLDKFNTVSYFEIAKIYSKNKNFKKALLYFNMSENSLKKSFNNTNNLKRSFLKEISPFYVKKSKIFYRRSLLYYKLNEYNLAYNDLSKINKRDKESQLLIAFTLIKLKKNKTACIEFDKAILLGSKKAIEYKKVYCKN